MKLNAMTIALFSFALVVILGVVYCLYFFFIKGVNPPLRQNTLTIGDHTWTVEIASTMTEKTRGLSGRESLADDHGMYFIFDVPSIQYFWMVDMKFPLDMIWIGGNKVLGFAQNDPAPAPGTPTSSLKIYNSPDGTDRVLEVVAGTVAKDNIQVGDPVVLSGD